ncbi:hypothetical protein [Microbacterium sp.]|uniref:hypothetical protein n=1 Tax=Microbacterium sp. TaxID=51671 RepID=UPI0039E222AD
MTPFQPGNQVVTQDGTRAEFVKYVSGPARGIHAVIRVGQDTRVVDPVTLKAVKP